MKSNFKTALNCALLLTAFSASAVQKDIIVTADIDPTLSITQSDGSALPTRVAMEYLPGVGLVKKSINVKLWSNEEERDLNVRLSVEPLMESQSGKSSIPLSISLNNKKLSQTDTVFSYGTIFPSGIASGSTTMPLSFSQATPGPITSAGYYSGYVSLVVTQATSNRNI